MRNLQKFSLVTTAMLVLPFIASAQTYLGPVRDFIVSIGNIIALLIPIAIGATMLVFFYGLIQYVKSGGKGTQTMIAGIASLFIMVSIWGIVRLAQTALGINQTNTISAPHFPTN